MTHGVLAALDVSHIPILLVLGFAVLAGTVGAKLFQRLRIPQVVGYIAIGIVLGRSGFQVIDPATIATLLPFNFFALGVIGFMIGGELHRELFKKYGRQFLGIRLAEGLGACLSVSVLVTATALLLRVDPVTAVALGIILGAISSATAPAATVGVLWEYKTRGILTTTVLAIVALDDALALALYSVAASVAAKLTGTGGGTFWGSLGGAAYELLGAAVLGAVAGFVLNFVVRRARERDMTLTLIVGMLALVLGTSLVLGLDLILAAMALGVTIANLAPRRTNEAFQIVARFTPPIYVLFFVFVGARLSFADMPHWMWAVAVVYVIARTAGKMIGAYLGARWSHAAETVRKNLGLCLFDQAGVAIGLAILAGARFPDPIGPAVITIVATTTFLVQILAPPLVKLGVKRAGEIGLDITEEDLARSYQVSDVMDRRSPAFLEKTTLAEILRTIADTDAMAYPVTDDAGMLKGVITIQDLKRSFSVESLTNWLLAHDLMEPVSDTVPADTPLAEAMLRIREQGLDFLPVVRSEDDPRLEGLLERSRVQRILSAEVLRRHQLADAPTAG